MCVLKWHAFGYDLITMRNAASGLSGDLWRTYGASSCLLVCHVQLTHLDASQAGPVASEGFKNALGGP